MRSWTSAGRWMRDTVCSMTAMACCAVAAVAQQPAATTGASGTVAGQIVNVDTRTPLSDVMVLIKGTELRTGTNAQGRFVIRNVPAGAHTVRAQLLGFAAQEQPVTVAAGQTATVDIAMKEVPYTVQPVVVTALGIERKQKSIGYAAQTISQEQIGKIPEPTLMQALSGQAAGVAVTSASGRPGAGARITIRGESSFSGNGQPLFVIDGVPVSTDTDSPSDALFTGSSGSRQMDLDMENISELTVLRGAAATALYGSRAANGAIIVTTKQGSSGQPLRFNLNTELRYDRPIIEGYTNNWAAGQNGYFCNGRTLEQGGWCEPGDPGTNPAVLQSWGPNIDSIPQIVFDSLGPIRFRDARSDFYETALTSNSSVRATGGMGDFGAYSLGVSYLNQGGVNPIEKLDRLNMNAHVNLTLSKRFSTETSIQRIRSENNFADDSYNGVDHALINLPPTTDSRTGYTADGTPIMLSGSQPSIGWLLDHESNQETTDRWMGSQNVTFSIVPGLSLTNKLGLDTYVSEYGRFLDERPWRTADGLTSGSTRQRKSTRTQINNDLLLTMDNRQLWNSPVSVSAVLGGNIYSEDASYVEGEGDDIVIPGFFNLNNFATQTTGADLPTQRRILGAYSQITADYSDWAFLTLTGRNDWSSTLPTNANSYFYPSASLAISVTDALKWHPGWLDFFKLRVSKAKVGNGAPAYSLSTRYSTGNLAKGANNDVQQFGGPSIRFPFRGIASFTSSTQLGNPELKPESTIEDEFGVEMRVFGGRAFANVSVYRKSSYDQIFRVPSSSVTGYTSIVRNAGDLRNNGVELSLGGRPVQIGDFSWDINVNWAKNNSKVLSLAPGVTSISLAGYSWPQIRIMADQPYGVIWGYGWKRNCVANDPCFDGVPDGTILIGDNGLPIKSDELRNLGTVPPNWTGSVSTQFAYKSFGLSALVDVRNGGKILNFETQYEVTNGRSILTKDRYTWTVEDGVNVNTGQQNTVRVFKDPTYYRNLYGQDRHENQIEPAGYTKLREISLSYRLGDALAERLSLQGATIYVTGRNLAVWSDFSLGDPEGDVYGGQNAGGQYLRNFSAPQTRSFVFGVRTIF